MIQIPSGYGSSAGEGFVFQEEGSTSDVRHVQRLYHEYAHVVFPIKAQGSTQRSRFFDEAIARFLSAKAVQHFYGDKIYDQFMDEWRDSFLRAVQADPRIASIPLAEYGCFELGHLSYWVGPWILHFLEELLGGREFTNRLRRFLAAHKERTATFESFRSALASDGDQKVLEFFAECVFDTKTVGVLSQFREERGTAGD